MSDQRTRVHNQHFSQICLTQILAKPAHPLRFLVDSRARRWRATRHGSADPAVQVGHLQSLHAGGPERLCLEDADFNQLSNWRGERQGAVFAKSCALIGGVHVELRTAKMWEATGMLPIGTVASSPRSDGWNPEAGRPAGSPSRMLNG